MSKYARVILEINPHDPFFIILKVLGVALLICAVLALIAWFAENAGDIIGSLLPAPEPEKKSSSDKKKEKLFKLSEKYGEKLKSLLSLYVEYFGDTYAAKDAWGDTDYYKRIKDHDEDTGEDIDITSSRIWVNNKLIFDAYGHPQILEDHHLLYELLDFEDKLLEIQAQKKEEKRREEQEKKRLAEIRKRIENLVSPVTCYLSDTLDFQDDKISICHPGSSATIIKWKGVIVFNVSATNDFSDSSLTAYRPGTGENDWENYIKTVLLPKVDAICERERIKQDDYLAKRFTPLSNNDFS